MTRDEVIKRIEEEWQLFRTAEVKKGAEHCFDNSYTILVTRSLYEYLIYDGQDEFSENDYVSLFRFSSGNILTVLTDEYFDNEDCDIARNYDIRQLINTYLVWNKNRIEPFTDDVEKMTDFYELSKEEFLASYSYLTEEEYDATAKAVNIKS